MLTFENFVAGSLNVNEKRKWPNLVKKLAENNDKQCL